MCRGNEVCYMHCIAQRVHYLSTSLPSSIVMLTLFQTGKRREVVFDSVGSLKPIQSSIFIHQLPITMSLSLLRTSLRSGQPSVVRGFASSVVRSNNVGQPLKTIHPGDVVSGNVAGVPATKPEDPRELAAEVVSDAPSESFVSTSRISARKYLGLRSLQRELTNRGTPTPSSPNLQTY